MRPGSAARSADPSSRLVTSAWAWTPASRPRRSASRGCRRGSGTGSRTNGTRGSTRPRGSRARPDRSGTRGSRAARDPGSCPDHREDLVGLLLQQLFRPCLHVQPQERLGVAGTHVEPPVVELYRQSVQAVLAAVRVRGRYLLDPAELIVHARADLAGREVPPEGTEQLGERDA